MTVTVVNQWAGMFAQPVTFGSMPPVLQSLVIPLTPASSTGGGSGTPTPGNWLFTLAGWNQKPHTTPEGLGIADDIHSWWRPLTPSPCVTYEEEVIADAPVAWWTLGDASGSALAIDSSGNRNNGTPSNVTFGNASHAVSGVTSASFASASSSHILTSYNPALPAVTVEAWVNLNGLTQSGDPMIIANSNVASDNKGFQLLLFSGTNIPAIWFGNGTGWSAVNGSALPSTGWTHLAGTWDGTTITFYVNGVSQGTTIFPGPMPAGAASGIGIGYNPTYSGNFVNGLIAECAVYQTALPAARILAHYQSAPVVEASTRSTIWYTPNIARTPGNVYISPNFGSAGFAGAVIEVSGLGPWDTVTATSSAYAAAVTSLNLAIGAPSASAFMIAAGTGDNDTVSQALAPAGWTALATVTATNGVDHTCDTVLTGAYIPATSSSASVNVTTSGASDLSGIIVGVLVTAPSPIPAGHNPDWPYLKFEAAFGSGYNTPPDQMTWTDLSSRIWSWNETTGIQYQLGELQATNLETELDNVDGYLSVLNTGSAYYPDITAGTPLRIRAAIGTIRGATSNRWYVIQRNALEWPEQIDSVYRRFSPVSGTDIWSAVSASPPTPYRGEVGADGPYVWYPMDDQPLAGGVLPVSLLNAAGGSGLPLTVQASPGGVSVTDSYTTTGIDATATYPGTSPVPPPSVAVYMVGAAAGWMYGDPQTSPATQLGGIAVTTLPSSTSTGGLITANPGSAAWQVSGLLGNTGTPGWFLTGNDPGYPPLAGGITVSGWFNAAPFTTAEGWHYPTTGLYYVIAGQPDCPLTVCELATASAPVAVLQLDTSGHLNLITYNGGTGTSHSIYSSSDLRCGSWIRVSMMLTTTTWQVLVNGGQTASVSGTAAGMTSAWSWLVLNGDLGTSGGSSLSSIVHSGNLALSHWAVYPYILPLWRELAQYYAAITGTGLLPVPSSMQAASVSNQFGTGYTPDGSAFNGSYGHSGGTVITSWSLSGLAVAKAGSYVSGPSARTTITGFGVDYTGTFDGAAVWTGWTSVAPSVQVYTAAAANAETEAAAALGAGDTFTSGFGSGATGVGKYQIAAGTGAAPPAGPSALGDTVGQRIERILGYANTTAPRCIDPAPLACSAALQIGGAQAGSSIQSLQQSDNGMLFVDNLGLLTYWQRPHLAAQYSSPVWNIGPTTSAGRIPYGKDIRWISDPQRVYNSIAIDPYSPDGSNLPIVTPQNATGVAASQMQYGTQPLEVTSYLQSQAEMQSQANWLFANFGRPQRRVENVHIESSTYPAAWQLVLGVNVGDIVAVEDWVIGGGAAVYTYRVTEIRRMISFGGGGNDVMGSVELTCDFEPLSYWT